MLTTKESEYNLLVSSISVPFIDCNKAIFIFCNNILVMPHDQIEYLYQKYYDKEDNYLYLYLAYENAFGN